MFKYILKISESDIAIFCGIFEGQWNIFLYIKWSLKYVNNLERTLKLIMLGLYISQIKTNFSKLSTQKSSRTP